MQCHRIKCLFLCNIGLWCQMCRPPGGTGVHSLEGRPALPAAGGRRRRPLLQRPVPQQSEQGECADAMPGHAVAWLLWLTQATCCAVGFDAAVALDPAGLRNSIVLSTHVCNSMNRQLSLEHCCWNIDRFVRGRRLQSQRRTTRAGDMRGVPQTASTASSPLVSSGQHSCCQ